MFYASQITDMEREVERLKKIAGAKQAITNRAPVVSLHLIEDAN